MTVAQPPPAGAPALPRSPYVGLVPYGERDSDFFFGRERDTRLIATNLRGSRLTLLYGASGVGKSSLLLAGVVPRLRERARPGLDDRPAFSVAVVRQWRADPVLELAEALRRSIEAASGAELPPWRREESLVAAVREWTVHVRTALLILDQFEEYFLYHPDEHGPDSFAAALAEIVDAVGLHVHVLISLREDALSRLDQFKATIPGLFSNYLRVDHLDRPSARRAIEGPAEQHAFRLPEDEEPVTIEPALVDAVLDQVRTGRLTLGEASAAATTAADPGGDRVETPFLQLVMERLWTTTVQRGERRLSLATLEELGGAERIVSCHLSEVLAQLGPERERLAAEVFAFLVTPSMTKIAQAPSDLAYWTRRPLEDVVGVVRDLAGGERRILRSVPPPMGDAADVERYEIFHDVLAEPISEWRAAQEQAREREDLAARLQVERAERQLAERRRRRAMAAAGGALLLAAVAVVALVIALAARNTAREQTERATATALTAAARSNLDSDPELSLMLAKAGTDLRPSPIAAEALRQAIADSRVRAVLRGARSRPCPACRIDGVADAPPGDVAIAPSGLVAAWAGPRLVVWTPVDGTSRTVASAGPRSVDAGGPVAFAADGRTVVRSPKRLVGYQPLPRLVSPDGATVAQVGPDGQVTIRHDGQLLPVKTGVPIGSSTPVIFSRDGRQMLVLAEGHHAELWRLGDRPKRRLDLTGHTDSVLSAAFSSDGTQVATGSADSTVRVWDTSTGETVAVLAGHDGDVTGVALAANGRMVASRGVDGTLRLWALREGRVLRDDTEAVLYARWSPDGRWVATGGEAGVLRVYDTRDWRVRSVANMRGVINAVDFDAGGRVLAGGLGDEQEGGVLVVDDPGSGQRAVAHLDRPVQAAAFMSRGGGILSADDAGLRLWTVDGSRLRASRRLAGLRSSNAVDTSHGMVAVAGRGDGQAYLLREDGRGGMLTLRAAPPSVDVYAASFSPDGQRLVTAGQQAPIRIWRVSDGRLLNSFRAVAGTTFSAEFSPDGRRVITSGVDGPVRIWDAATGWPVAVLREHLAATDAASFSPDGRSILSAGDDRTARIYPCEPCAPPRALMTLANDRVSRELTDKELQSYGGG